MSDRIVEVDLAAFDPEDLAGSALRLVETAVPILRNATGAAGLVINVGWIADFALEFGGVADQRLAVQGRRLARWSRSTYAQLRELVALIRARASDAGLSLRVGCLVTGYGRFLFPDHNPLYDVPGLFIERHPECFVTPKGEYQMPGIRLPAAVEGDDRALAAYPRGWPRGTPFAEVLARQLAATVRFLGMEILLLRDGWPLGGDEGRAFMVPLIRTLKREGVATVLGYSGSKLGLKAAAEGEDLGPLFEAGLDGWITQTWGGAWQEWWNNRTAGWPMQITHLLANHLRVPSDRKHFHLVELRDGYEPWDMLSWFPEKVRWAAHALGRASDLSTGTPRTTDGVYVSWLNNSDGQLITPQESARVASWLDEADPRGTWRPAGPAVVLDLGCASADPRHWIEEQVALLMHWGVACLATTTAAAFEQGVNRAAAYIIPARVLHSESILTRVDALLDRGVPLLVVGDPTDAPATLLDWAGVAAGPARQLHGYLSVHGIGIGAGAISHYAPGSLLRALEPQRVLVGSCVGDLLVRFRRGRGLWWVPPSPMVPEVGTLVRNQYGGWELHCKVAAAFNELLHDAGVLAPVPLHEHEAMCVHGWHEGGGTTVLMGNVVGPAIGDARWPREPRIAGRRWAVAANGMRIECVQDLA